MWKKAKGSETVLDGDRLGDEQSVKAVLTEWGTDSAAIERMLSEHRARQASARRAASLTINHPAAGHAGRIKSPDLRPR